MKTLLPFFCITLFGCAPAYVQPQINPEGIYEADYNAVWSALVETFSKNNYPIKAIEKESGIITTDYIAFPTPPVWGTGTFDNMAVSPERYNAMWMPRSGRCTISAYASAVDPNQTKLRINTHIEAFDSSKFGGGWKICYSNGYLEYNILDDIRKRIPKKQ
ncbi:MAG: hypothetical protein JXM79_11055 [Sedimentisphaerales bacterium]|nr:hypothetical protein [Sedimentisphaerales bacterium]